MSFEKPEIPTLETQDLSSEEKIEAFLSRDLSHLNLELFRVFKFIDAAKKDKTITEHAEAREARASGARDLAFVSRYGEHVLSAVLEKEKGLDDARKDALFLDYKVFCHLLQDLSPEMRPRLLAAIVPTKEVTQANEKSSRNSRGAFNRLIKELYGYETKTACDEKGKRLELFLPIDGQIDLLEAWARKEKWELNLEDFQKIRSRIPDMEELLRRYEHSPLVAPVVTPFLPGAVNKRGFERTFNKLWRLAGGRQHYGERDLSIPLRMLEGLDHRLGLSMDILDLGANRGVSVDDVRGRGLHDVPHAHLLAALALHSKWAKTLDTRQEVPDIAVAGYAYSNPGSAMPSAPRTDYRRGILSLEPYPINMANAHVAVPRILHHIETQSRFSEEER